MNYWSKLVKFAKPFWKYFLSLSIVIFVMSVLRQVQPLVYKNITDKVGEVKSIDQSILVLLGILLIVAILHTILNRISWYLAHTFSYKLRFNLRELGYQHLLSLPLEFFNSRQSGKLMSQLDRGTTQITSIINNSGMFIVPNTITSVIGLIIISRYNIWIALALLFIFFPIGILNYW